MAESTAPNVVSSLGESQAKSLVLWSMIAAGGLTAVSAWTEEGRVSARVGVAVWVGAILLTASAEFAPQAAGGLAVLILVASVIVTGPDVWRQLTSRLNAPRFPDEDTDVAPGSRGRVQQPDELRDQPRGGTTFA